MQYNRTQIIVKHHLTGQDILFDSETEANFYLQLVELEYKGEINNIIIKPSFVLIPPFTYFGQKIEGCIYTPDFAYYSFKEKRMIYIEVKGIMTDEFRLRLKLWQSLNQDKRLYVVCYSKATGWLEMHDYKKARKKIVKEQLEERAKRRVLETQEKERKKREKLELRYNSLLEKKKLNKKEKIRLIELKDLLGYNEE